MSKLLSSGYDHYDLFPSMGTLGYEKHWNSLKRVFSNLPRDPYAGPDILRYRRYSSGLYNAWLGEFEWVKPSLQEEVIYNQGGYNPEYPETTRKFASIPCDVLCNPVLKLLIDNDFHRTRFVDEQPDAIYRVGVHLVRLKVDKDHPIVTVSPDCLHCDGEPYTFAHLVNHESVIGGENYIATVEAAGRKPDSLRPDEIIAEFVLQGELESFAVDDRQVSHALATVRLAPGATMGLRDIVLIDFTPLMPVLG